MNTTSKGDRILAQLLNSAESKEEIGDLAYDLLKEIFRGYSVHKLESLVASDRDDLVDAAAWIISELGTQASTMFPVVSRLLRHRNGSVRFWAIDAVLAAAGPGDGALVADAISLIGDPESPVRWEVLFFLSRAPEAVLAASRAHIQETRLAGLVGWLVSDEVEFERIAVLLSSENQLDRRVACAAAVRTGLRDDRALQHAADLDDQEVRKFALEELDILNKDKEKGRRRRRRS